MKRNKVFILGKLSEKELEIFKRDIFSHSLQMALKIKNLNFSKEQIELVVRNSVDYVCSKYSSDSGNSLGELVKIQVLVDLRTEYEKTYPGKTNKVKWPDLASRVLGKGSVKSIKKHRLVEIQKLNGLSGGPLQKILTNLTPNLNGRQKELLLNLLNTKKAFSHFELSEKLGVKRATITNDIRAIYSHLIHTLKFLGIEI